MAFDETVAERKGIVLTDLEELQEEIKWGGYFHINSAGNEGEISVGFFSYPMFSIIVLGYYSSFIIIIARILINITRITIAIVIITIVTIVTIDIFILVIKY